MFLSSSLVSDRLKIPRSTTACKTDIWVYFGERLETGVSQQPRRVDHTFSAIEQQSERWNSYRDAFLYFKRNRFGPKRFGGLLRMRFLNFQDIFHLKPPFIRPAHDRTAFYGSTVNTLYAVNFLIRYCGVFETDRFSFTVHRVTDTKWSLPQTTRISMRDVPPPPQWLCYVSMGPGRN